MDVVVTDRGGHFIPGLKPGDFTVLEDGKPEKIAAFGMHAQPAYQSVLKRGFPGHIDLELKPGKYVLRPGAIDRSSQKIGTVDVSLDVPAETVQK